MALWQRLLITFVTMLVASFVAELVWHWIFKTDIPGYLSGIVGGLAAVPTWEFLKRVHLKPSR
jgi:hypothetical protein